jgi:hypothetical protein
MNTVLKKAKWLSLVALLVVLPSCFDAHGVIVEKRVVYTSVRSFGDTSTEPTADSSPVPTEWVIVINAYNTPTEIDVTQAEWNQAKVGGYW